MQTSFLSDEGLHCKPKQIKKNNYMGHYLGIRDPENPDGPRVRVRDLGLGLRVRVRFRVEPQKKN